MKKFFLLVAFVIVSNTLFAQYKPFQLGFKASPTLGWFNANDVGLKGEGTSIGFTGGFVAEFNFTENYMILTGVNYNYSRGKLSYQGINATTDTQSIFYQQIADVQQTVKFQYLEIPVSVKLRTNKFGKVRIYGQMGLNTAFCFNAKSDRTYSFTDSDKKFNTKQVNKEDVKNDFTLVKESLLLGIGSEINIDQSSFISVGLNFNTALNNIAKFNYSYEGVEKKAKTTLSYFELNIAFIF
ncbi:MAG: porin family protein [Bacteroidales bacterium]|nr:porin family protein [Bacteroidales bacterium]